MALAVKTVQRMMVEKGLCTSDEFRTRLQQLDLEDGKADGRSPTSRRARTLVPVSALFAQQDVDGPSRGLWRVDEGQHEAMPSEVRAHVGLQDGLLSFGVRSTAVHDANAPMAAKSALVEES